MDVHILPLVLIIGGAILALWVNSQLNNNATLNKVVVVLVVVVAIFLMLQSLGLVNMGTGVSLR